MHTTEQDFLATPSLKCIALNIPSDKVPLENTVSHLLHSSPQHLKHQMLNFPLFEMKWYVKYVLPLMQKSAAHIKTAEAKNFGCALVATQVKQEKVFPTERLPTEMSSIATEQYCILHLQTLSYALRP